MIAIQKITVDSFKIPKIYRPVLIYHNKVIPRDLLLALEQYGIKTRDEIVYTLNDYATDPEDYVYIVTDDEIKTSPNAKVDQKGQWGNVYTSIQPIPRPLAQQEKKNESMKAMESMYNVHLDVSGDTIYVYHSLFDVPNKDVLTVTFSMYNLKFIPITETNLLELQGKNLPSYDLILLFRILVIECMKAGGSDLKIFVVHEKLQPVVKVMFRVDETLIEFIKFKITLREEINMVKQLISQLSKIPVSTLDSGGTEVSLNQILCTDDIECRMAINQTIAGYNVDCRLRNAIEEAYDLDKLNLDRSTIEALKFVANKKSGGTFLTGAMKTGKSTTLWALLNEIRKRPVMCVEYSHPIEAKVSIPQADYTDNLELLKHYLSIAKKQDINVVLLNEIPNKDIAQHVRELINANVHVLTTLHMNRVWHFPQLFATFYGDAYKDFITQMNLIVTQKMIVKQCPHCRYTIPVQQLDSRMRTYLLAHGIETVTENTGCEYCNNGDVIGGRTVFAEYFMFTNEAITRLRHAENPGDMEQIVKDIVTKDEEYVSKKVSIEAKVIDAIKKGEVSYKALYDLI